MWRVVRGGRLTSNVKLCSTPTPVCRCENSRGRRVRPTLLIYSTTRRFARVSRESLGRTVTRRRHPRQRTSWTQSHPSKKCPSGPTDRVPDTLGRLELFNIGPRSRDRKKVRWSLKHGVHIPTSGTTYLRSSFWSVPNGRGTNRTDKKDLL